MYAANYVPRRDMAQSITGCCPPFDPAEWDGKTFVFDEKLFMKFTTRSLFHIPLNMNAAMRKAMAAVEAAGAKSDEYLMLSEEVSAWKAVHIVALTKEVQGKDMVKLSGTYIAKVFEGPYKNMRDWYVELIDYVENQGKKPLKTYFIYAFCPKCAKAYGKNYVVGFEQVQPAED